MKWILVLVGIAWGALVMACGSAPPLSSPPPSLTLSPARDQALPPPTAPRTPTAVAVAASPAVASAELSGQFVAPLSTIEELGTIELELRRVVGVMNVHGSENSVTITYEAARVTPERLRQVLADLGHALR